MGRTAPRPATHEPALARWCAAALLLVLASLTAPAVAQDATPTDLWVPLVDEFAHVPRAEVETVFSEVLGGPSGPNHIVGLTGMAEVIGRTGFDLPPCFEGRDVCSNNVEAIARGLMADRVIYVEAQPRLGEVLRLTLVDIELGQRVELEVRGDDLREAVFAAVSAVTNASAHLTLASEPEGAEVYLDGVRVGTTPYESTLGIGSYDLRLVLEGYYDYGSPIELRSGDVRTEAVAMERRYAEVLVETDAPGAEIVVDGDETFPANETFRLLPGERELEIRAPGYDSANRTLQLVAGEERSYRVTLVESAETIARRKFETIRSRPLTIQFGMAGATFGTDWAGARARLDGTRERVTCPVDPTSVTGDCLDPTPVGLLGADLSVIYDWRLFELELAGFGMRRLNLRSDRTTYGIDGSTETLSGRQGREMFFHLPAPGVRWQANQDWSVVARTGPALSFQRIEASRDPGGDAVRMRRTDWLWRVVAGGRYNVTSAFFAFGEVELGIPFAGGTGSRFGGSLGIGLDFADPLGIHGRLEQRDADRHSVPADAPEEL